MGYFKRFTDFCSGFSAFTAIMFLFRRYMTYKFAEDELGIKYERLRCKKRTRQGHRTVAGIGRRVQV